MRLKYQLFLTLLLASALLVVLMFFVSSWSFSRGFLGYINGAQLAAMEPMASDIADLVRQRGNLDWAVPASPEWRRLLAENRFQQRSVAPGPVPAHSKGERAFARPRQPGAERFVPGEGPLNHRRQGLRGGKPPDDKSKRRFETRIILADNNKNTLIGRKNRDDRVAWVAISVDRETVAYLGYKKMRRLHREFDQAFERQQRKGFGFAALTMVALSILLSIPLATRIVKPLLTVNRAVREISTGNYSHRVDLARDDEFGDLASDINRLGGTLEENRTARQRWIAEISHELRTPVSVMRSELEAVQDGIREFDNQSLDSLHSEALRLTRLIDDLHSLSLSDVGALEYRMNVLDLSVVLKDLLDSHSQVLSDAGLKVDFENRATVSLLEGDVVRLEQLFSNLIQNSIRYTEEGGYINVKLLNPADAETLVVNWQDSAPGVEDSSLEKLFDPLFRTDESRNRESGGAGLGLAIVSRIVKGHRGKSTATHSALGGLKISIEFPSYRGVVA